MLIFAVAAHRLPPTCQCCYCTLNLRVGAICPLIHPFSPCICQPSYLIPSLPCRLRALSADISHIILWKAGCLMRHVSHLCLRTCGPLDYALHLDGPSRLRVVQRLLATDPHCSHADHWD